MDVRQSRRPGGRNRAASLSCSARLILLPFRTMSLFRRTSPSSPSYPVDDSFESSGLYVGPHDTVEISCDASREPRHMYFFTRMGLVPPPGGGAECLFLAHGLPEGAGRAQAVIRQLLASGYVRSEHLTRSAYDYARWLEQNPVGGFTPERGRVAYEALLAARAEDPESDGYEERLRAIVLEAVSAITSPPSGSERHAHR